MPSYASFGDGKSPPKIPGISRDPSLSAYSAPQGDLRHEPVHIDGSILSVTGISGLSVGVCAIDFFPESAVVSVGHPGNQIRVAYPEITTFQVGGRGDVVTTTGGGWSGGGIFPADLRGSDFNPLGGIGNAAKSVLTGVVLSTVLNKLTTTKTRRTETILHFAWQSGSVTFLNTAHPPFEWARRLGPVFREIEASRSSTPSTPQQGHASTGEKTCPYCAETIKAAAIKCRYCGSMLA